MATCDSTPKWSRSNVTSTPFNLVVYDCPAQDCLYSDGNGGTSKRGTVTFSTCGGDTTNTFAAGINACEQAFGADGFVLYAVACVVSYVISSHRGIYASQRLAIAKGLSNRATLLDRKEAWADAYRRTPHGTPVVLAVDASAQRRP